MADGSEPPARNGPILLGIAAVVVLAGLAGYFLLRGEPGSDDSASGDAARAPRRPSNVVDTRERPARDASVAVTPPRDRPPAPAPPSSISDLPVIAKRADGREIPPALTSKFSTQVKDAIRECAKSIPTEHRPHARMTGVLTLGISGGTARISGAKLSLTEVPEGPEHSAALACLQSAIVGTTQPTTEADLSDYEIAVSMFLFPGATGAAKRAAAAAGSAATE